MKKIIALALALVLAISLAACGEKDTGSTGGNSNTPGTSRGGSNNSNAQSLITEDIKTGEGSEARNYYYADTVHEEFTFAKDGTLTGYKKIYSFVKGADKEKALKYITLAEFKAAIEGNTLVVDGNGNYLGFHYAESNLNEIKKRLNDRGAKYTLK
ncbi:MAG: hypothetical protein LBU43_03305 [Candidatus Accumulibacter sp.]|jgi:uncharacterized lipoprotein YehR (DUF1307 family)|nr:hypothetical protein [Accumulibacter sp.]